MLASRFCKIHGEKHPRAFVKVVEGSEISNFGIHCSVHFSTNFWSKSQSNQSAPQHVVLDRDVASRRAPARAAARQGRPPWRSSPRAASRGLPFPRPRAHRGCSNFVPALTTTPLYPPVRCHPPPCVGAPINAWPEYTRL
jgi:hypothetical protein